MGGTASRNKGKRGERDVVNILNSLLVNRSVSRNLNQTRNGGADIIAEPFAIEVKNCKTLTISKWWKQAVKQAEQCSLKPVLVFKSKGKWVVKMNETKNYLTMDELAKAFNDASDEMLKLLNNKTTDDKTNQTESKETTKEQEPKQCNDECKNCNCN